MPLNLVSGKALTHQLQLAFDPVRQAQQDRHPLRAVWHTGRGYPHLMKGYVLDWRLFGLLPKQAASPIIKSLFLYALGAGIGGHAQARFLALLKMI